MARCRCRAKSFEGDQDGPPHVEGRGPPYLLAPVYIQKCLPRNGMAMPSRIEDERIVVGTKRATSTSGLLACSILRSTEYQPSAPLSAREHADISPCASRRKRDTCFGQWTGSGAIERSHAVAPKDHQLPASRTRSCPARGGTTTDFPWETIREGFTIRVSPRLLVKRGTIKKTYTRNPVDRPLAYPVQVAGTPENPFQSFQIWSVSS
ncbi:hypothetical protein FFLO_06285 [Filobasidium floriforme]|uniref:Uncharacterized protein n=1 Tax=Filobasidium floriforme TaxID=5210 RepID=A0A8K0NN53_9TREE|nr:uncharacterized protein HD553DRAFT_37599 [Filobasidium floriforme]KAG7528253.1 hypothetical protein FFLO_06285 [Filobasidium floriforme]KAH8084007.1 hypothetical protein HD553DRAFT_37599 [Filobasidium floriforme]